MTEHHLFWFANGHIPVLIMTSDKLLIDWLVGFIFQFTFLIYQIQCLCYTFTHFCCIIFVK